MNKSHHAEASREKEREQARAYYGEMAWDNYGRVWVLDHIMPCAAFDMSVAEQRQRCFHWSNLRPILHADNAKKGATIPETVT